MPAEYRTYISKDIFTSLEFTEWKKHLSKDSTVFFKPYFTYPYYKEGITINPQVIRCLLELLQDYASRVIVGESGGRNHSFSADQKLKITKCRRMASNSV